MQSQAAGIVSGPRFSTVSATLSASSVSRNSCTARYGNGHASAAVLVFERQSIVRARGHTPRRLPAVSVLGVRLWKLVERKATSCPPNEKRPSRIRLENGTSGKQARRSAVRPRDRPPAGAQPVKPARAVEPVEMRERAADAGRDAGEGAARAKLDDGVGTGHVSVRASRQVHRIELKV
jgi:hypothetical protein